jgi:hypothetical protein
MGRFYPATARHRPIQDEPDFPASDLLWQVATMARLQGKTEAAELLNGLKIELASNGLHGTVAHCRATSTNQSTNHTR